VARIINIVILILAGEMAFALPFSVARFFRPTMLEVFGFTNTQLGDVSAIYGVTAMLSYFPGGALADRFSARTLLTASLIATGAGGLYMATIPDIWGMSVLFGFWGVTTIFLFWGALIRATREWGSSRGQGIAFGLLEGGRGITAALSATILVTLFSLYMPDNVSMVTDAERKSAFQVVVLGYSALTIGVGVLAWFLVPDPEGSMSRRSNIVPNMLLVIRRPVVWAQAAIVVGAYSLFKAADTYALYLTTVIGMDEVRASEIASWAAYIRPPAAILAGLVAFRFNATTSIGVIFALGALVALALSIFGPDSTTTSLIFLNLAISVFVVYALRGIYFALLEETRTPRQITGAAVGLVSVVGFTPEIFMGPIAGRILDATPGLGGFQDLFTLLTIISLASVMIVAWLIRLKHNDDHPVPGQ
jgi:sugar phosphate permease